MIWLIRAGQVLTFGPLLIWLGSFIGLLFVGFVLGCEVNEGSVQPCMFLGQDIGEIAYAMGIFAAWGSLIMGPIALFGGILWASAALVRRALNRRRDE